jgi:hypothetical protein
MTNTLEDIYKILDSIKPNENGCHIYPSKSPIGWYRRVKIGSKEFRAHRISLERKLDRPLLPGYFALHTCDNPPCVNPDHLYEGTKQDNNIDIKTRRPGLRSQSTKLQWQQGRGWKKKT